uniref:NADH dehydrogenase subunit 2 n=1 Tax=Barbibucca biremis TaxID=1265316 RepID=UPI003003907C|nr:NADH dehydrogenase subunit 2 [Barbibucca biremis]
MIKNVNMIVFLSSLIAGTMISISSNSWIGAWMGLEINLMSFIPLLSSSKNMTTTESALKYFLVQALASSILLFAIMSMLTNLNSNLIFMKLLLNSSLLIKIGAAPFHFWFPEVMEGISWMMSFILMTWQKIAPFILISYCLELNFTYIIILMSIILGSIGGLNQTNLRSLMAYSSINHIGWMLSSLFISNKFWLIYFMFYTLISLSIVTMFSKMNIFYFNQLYSAANNEPILKFLMFCNFLSLGGLPPFTGFLPKWIIIQNLAINNMFLVSMMVTFTLLTLFFYVRITYSAFTINSSLMSWNKFKLIKMNLVSILMNFFSIFLLISATMMFDIL